STSAGGTGLTTAQARQQASYVGWDFTNDWFMINGQTRPFLRSEYSTTITNAHQLQLISMNLGASYTLANNIDLGPALAADSNANYPGMWGPAGFVPIGSFGNFEGRLDGQGRTIDKLTIAPTANNIWVIGLFGQIGTGGVVQNLNLTNVDIHANPNLGTGYQFVGALAGVNGGLIVHVTASGTIDGGTVSGVHAGGLVGQNGFFNGTLF